MIATRWKPGPWPRDLSIDVDAFSGVGCVHNLRPKAALANHNDHARYAPADELHFEQCAGSRIIMRLGLLLIFIAVPLLELVVLIKVGQLIGLWPTVLIVVVTAIAGTTILHRQGFLALNRAVEAVERGELPIEPVADGVLLLLAGALLLTPGLITDAAGLLLLVPPLRRRLARWAFKRLIERARRPRRQRGASGGRDREGVIIEGEFERVEDPSTETQPPEKRR